jgi:hypothetical protein
MAQVQSIARQSAGLVEILALADCRHSAHRDQAEAVLEAITQFVAVAGGNKNSRHGV